MKKPKPPKPMALTHAMHDPAHCLAPGLFRSFKRGERKKQKLDITYDYGEGESARFVGFEPLGVDDMRILQGLTALAGPEGLVLTPEPQSDMARQLRLFLEPKFDAENKDGLVVRQRMTNLLGEIGMVDSGANINTLKASLLRMSNITVLATKNTRQASFHMLSYDFEAQSGELFVALNPRIAEAVLGRRAHTRIEMAEVRGLKTDPARLMHQRLCGWIDPGKSRQVELDTLCSYVWADPTSNANTLKSRRQAIRKGLAELAAVGWTVDEYAKAKFNISRPCGKK